VPSTKTPQDLISVATPSWRGSFIKPTAGSDS